MAKMKQTTQSRNKGRRQYAALPIRFTGEGKLQVLLLTFRGTGRCGQEARSRMTRCPCSLFLVIRGAGTSEGLSRPWWRPPKTPQGLVPGATLWCARRPRQHRKLRTRR